MSTIQDVHKELQSLGPEIIKILDDIDPEATPMETWTSISESEKKRYKKMAEKKNSRVWDIIAGAWIADGLWNTAKSLSVEYDIPLPDKTTLLLSDYVKDYFDTQGLKFVKQTTVTDFAKLKAWIWGQTRYADVPLLKQPNLNYIVDGGARRANLIKNVEIHRATMRGGQLFMGDAGFKYNSWETRKDNRVRQSHRLNQGETVEIGKPFPSGETVPGQVIGCRCWLEYS